MGSGHKEEYRIGPFISQAFDMIAGDALFQREEDQRESIPERANDAGDEWMKSSGSREAHADPALLAPCRPTRRLKHVIKMEEYRASLPEENMTSLGQLNATRLAKKQLYIKCLFQ